jgi:hypothetical protein
VLLGFVGREQDGMFNEAAKFLLADVMVCALAAVQVLEGLVFNFQTLQMNDSKI